MFDWQIEREIHASLARLWEEAVRIRDLHATSGVPLPSALRRLFGEPDEVGQVEGITIPPPKRPPAPPEAEEGWIWVRVSDGYVATVALALLRAAEAPIRLRDLQKMVKAYLPEANDGSIANLASRLSDRIARSREGWRLISTQGATVLHEGHLWGPPEAFVSHELAAYRRDCEEHVLRLHPSGLQQSQIVDVLERCSWLQVPIAKDLVKMDIEALSQAGRVRRRGASRKVEAIVSEAGGD